MAVQLMDLNSALHHAAAFEWKLRKRGSQGRSEHRAAKASVTENLVDHGPNDDREECEKQIVEVHANLRGLANANYTGTLCCEIARYTANHLSDNTHVASTHRSKRLRDTNFQLRLETT
jgi:hypothetical protein